MSMARKRRYDATEQEADSSHIQSEAHTVHVKETEATDEEIDEFFAILKRAQEARNWIRSVKTERGREVKRDVWQPRFAPEDFQLDNTARDDGLSCNGSAVEEMTDVPVVPVKNVVVPMRLDLNAIPDEICLDTYTYDENSRKTREVVNVEFVSPRVPNHQSIQGI
jgi:NPR1 interacting